MKEKQSLQIELKIIGSSEKRPPLAVYAYDLQGRLLGHEPIGENAGKLVFKEKTQGQARIFVGPAVEDGRPLSLAELKRIKAVERRVELTKERPLVFEIAETLFPYWIWCFCVIRGRVVVRQQQPDGTLKELPLCNARVTVCEVDPWPIIIRRIPDLELRKVRDELLLESQLLPQESMAKIKAVTEPKLLRELMIDCKFPWWPRWHCWPWFFRKDCFTTVNTDETGHFITYYFYPCHGDKPDLWFKVEQQIDGVWRTVYAPRLPGGVHWNYPCGSEVVIEVDDPAARPCYPEDTVISTETTWLHPLAVGGMYIAGNAGIVPAGTTGWVRPDGRGSYTKAWIDDIGDDVTDAPFGSTLGLRMNWSDDLPTAAIAYYRFSYRKKGSGDAWAHMTTPISRHYVHTEPQGAGQPLKVSYPSINLGPVSVGGKQNLCAFRPHSPSGVEAGAPAGTTHAWPVNLAVSSDLYAAYLPTAGLADGETYEIRVEAFSNGGAKVAPGAAFTFIVTTSVSGGTINTRNAAVSEQPDGDFVFDLYIDDRNCQAEISSPSTPHGMATDCGFLQYSADNRVSYGWLADHPGDEARWRFTIAKGSTGTVFQAIGEAGGSATITGFPIDPVTNIPIVPTAADQISLTGGNYSGSIDAGTLLGSCSAAAFAESLYVWNKATDGWQRLGGSVQDQSDLEAFAMTIV